MVSIPNTQEAEIQIRSVKFGINSVHTQKSPSNNKMEATNQTGLPIFSNNYQNDKLTATQWIQEVTRLKTKAAWTNSQSFVDDLNSGVLTRFLLLCLREGDLNGF